MRQQNINNYNRLSGSNLPYMEWDEFGNVVFEYWADNYYKERRFISKDLMVFAYHYIDLSFGSNIKFMNIHAK